MGFGFEILSSKIGEKIPFGPDTKDNKDRFFNKLELPKDGYHKNLDF